MASPQFNRSTLVCVGVVLASGLVAGADMFRHLADPGLGDAADLVVFGGLGVFWTLLTFHAGPSRGGRAAVTLAPAAYLSMIAAAQPAVTAATACTVLLVDWAAHRRHSLAGLFNIGQTLVALWCALELCSWFTAVVPGAAGVAAGTLLGGVAYSVVNMTLLQFVLRLASGRRAAQTGIAGYSALTNEIVVSCFAAIMALCWTLFPPLLMLPVIPQTLLFLILSRLEQREASLRLRQSELQSLQELGLQVSAQLDAERLGPVVARIVAEDLRARGALVGLLTEDEQAFQTVASFDADPDGALPPTLERAQLTDEFLADGVPLAATEAEVAFFPDFARLGVTQLIAHPLSILGRAEGVIVVFDGGARETFTPDDAERLSSLVRFIEVSWTNSRLYDDVKSMQQALVQSEKMSALGQLVSGVAHELNNPLATIMGSAELLGGGDLSADQRKMMRRILKETDRAARIVRNLLTFSRHQKAELTWGDVNQVVAEVVEMRAYECASNGVSLETDVEEDLPPIKMDPFQIHQVLLNLVTNAMHALESSGEGGRILVRTARENRRVRLEVSDNGHGIDEAKLDKIFNPFFTTKPVGKGTGLGLSICYGIVQQHAGTIRVHSAPDEGATFVIELPVPVERPPVRAPEPEAAPDTGAHAQMGGRALVVDDEPGIRGVLREALTAWGFEVEEAASGEEGLRALRHGRFALAILDLRMPGLDGRQLYERAAGEGRLLPPVIFSTGDVASPGAREFLEGVDAPVLLKPFTLISLRETIEELLAREPAGAGV